ncbi:uncharacterized protein ACIB01_019622 isoform 1-T1 [Guaruba guarouba]
MATVNMQQGYAAVLWVLAVLVVEATALGECELTRLLQDKLQYEMRLQYMTDVEVVVADLVKLIHSAGMESRRKAVCPKALLDNCLKVMWMLYRAPCWWEST